MVLGLFAITGTFQEHSGPLEHLQGSATYKGVPEIDLKAAFS